ncbi:MAG: two-CW domain-containing protein [Thermodesulfovibrionales bacterium]
MSDRKSKLNCWEFKKCGRQPQGHRVHELGLCPAPMEERLDGVHDGVNAGRSCWIIAGTMCGGKVQGTFAEKFNNCEQCDFYAAVKTEEYPSFQLVGTLLGKMRRGAE